MPRQENDAGFMGDIEPIYWDGPRLYPEFDLAERVNSEFGLEVEFSEAEAAFLDSRLDMRDTEEEARHSGMESCESRQAPTKSASSGQP